MFDNNGNRVLKEGTPQDIVKLNNEYIKLYVR